ncbi:MAG TPA: methyltransferase [Firmicutes bacterium]|jgi:2-polyprenyl-3-methyl-5-hydroxy-6-metoxy-1,4-benzoquinol methylase|nr:methyltransferase [Bacillota bacterium]
MNACYLCGEKSFQKRPGRVRDNENLDILECRSCGLVFLSSFDHITPGFYENSQMDGEDASIENWVHETVKDDQRRFNTFQSLITNKTVLDFGCGNGGFLLQAQKVAAKVAGIEPERRLKPYFKKQQLPVYSNLGEIEQLFEVITLFHVLEHLPDPLNVLQQVAARLEPGGCIIIEVPNADDILLKVYESDAFANFTYWSCHLFLFTAATLSLLAKKAGLQINYIKQIQRYPLSNHLHWLSRKKPGGHIRWSFLDSKELHDAYEKQLASIGGCDTLVASFGVGHD